MRGPSQSAQLYIFGLVLVVAVVCLLLFTPRAHAQFLTPDSRGKAGQAAMVNRPNAWPATQAGRWQILSDASGTITPNAVAGNYWVVKLTGTGRTFANPVPLPTPGQCGNLEIYQDASGSRTITTWGSLYIVGGATATISLSSGANNRDFFSYCTAWDGVIVLSQGAANATH